MSEVPYEPVNTPPPPPNYGSYQPPPPSSGMSENTAAALAYLTFVPAVLFLILEPYKRSHFIRFHSFQCIILSIAWIVVRMVIGFIPFFRWVLWPVAGLAFFIIWLVTILKASKGEWFKLPVIGDLAFEQSKV